MRQKLDFSLLVLTSFLVVLALEPGAKFPSSQATVGQSAIAATYSHPAPFGPALPASWLAQANHSSLENPHFNPTGTVFGATEERLLRLWELKNKQQGRI